MPKPTNPDRILGTELISGAWNIPIGPVKKFKIIICFNYVI